MQFRIIRLYVKCELICFAINCWQISQLLIFVKDYSCSSSILRFMESPSGNKNCFRMLIKSPFFQIRTTINPDKLSPNCFVQNTCTVFLCYRLHQWHQKRSDPLLQFYRNKTHPHTTTNYNCSATGISCSFIVKKPAHCLQKSIYPFSVK